MLNHPLPYRNLGLKLVFGLGFCFVLGFLISFLIGLVITPPQAKAGKAMDTAVGGAPGCMVRGMLKKDSIVNVDTTKLTVVTGVGYALREVHVLDTLAHEPIVPGDVLFIHCHVEAKDTLADSINVLRLDN